MFFANTAARSSKWGCIHFPETEILSTDRVYRRISSFLRNLVFLPSYICRRNLHGVDGYGQQAYLCLWDRPYPQPTNVKTIK